MPKETDSIPLRIIGCIHKLIFAPLYTHLVVLHLTLRSVHLHAQEKIMVLTSVYCNVCVCIPSKIPPDRDEQYLRPQRSSILISVKKP